MSNWKTLVKEDREAVLARDPAARSMAEVRLCYPGLVALKAHRPGQCPLSEGPCVAGENPQPACETQDGY